MLDPEPQVKVVRAERLPTVGPTIPSRFSQI